MLMPNEGSPTPTDEAKWTYTQQNTPAPQASNPAPAASAQNQDTVSWTASEFIEKQKDTGWHFLFFAAIVIISVLIFVFTHDYVAPIAIGLAGIIFVVITSKKPRELPYELSNQGIRIGQRFYGYEVFKSFGLAQEGGIKSINLLPLQRFMPEISIYFPPDQEAAIINLLSLHLPHEEHVEKTVDKFAKKLGF